MFAYFFNTRKFLPDEHYQDIYSVDFRRCYESGIRYLLIDLDNTLIPYDIDVPEPKLIRLFEDILSLGFEAVIVSNNKRSRIKPFATLINLPYVSSAKKPLKWGFKKALNHFKGKPKQEEILVLGDQLMTDVYGAKRMGFSAYLINPIKKRSEKWYTKINRFLEKNILKRMKKRYPKEYQRLSLEER